MKNPYSFDFTTNTLVMTKAFAEKASKPMSKEYKLVQRIKADNPSMNIALNTHSTPSHYHNKDGSITRNNQFKGLTIKRMEKFINALPNNEQYLLAFNFLKEQSSYTVLAKWFKKQFPNYATNPFYYLNNHVEIVEMKAYLEDASSF